MESERSIKNRLVCYFFGLFIMTAGIAVSVKSNLGVSPVSSIPYTMTKCWGLEMGIATVIFHCVLVLLQLAILRKNFKPKILLQIPIGIIFGIFTSLCNYLVSFLPTPENLVIRVIMVLISVVLVAVGIFFYLPANIVPLAGEGVMQAISQTTKIEFSKVKIAFDVTMVVVSVSTCLLVIHSFGSVGVGTVISAVLVGLVLGQITRFWNRHKMRKLK